MEPSFTATQDLAMALCRCEPDFQLQMEPSPGLRSSYAIRMWTHAESQDVLRCYLALNETADQRQFDFLVAAEGYEPALERALQPEEPESQIRTEPEHHLEPDLYTKIADLIEYAIQELEKGEDMIGRLILWSQKKG